MKPSGILIDRIAGIKTNLVEIDEQSYMARPLRLGKKWPLMSLPRRLRGCWRVLMGKGLVVYYKEDE